MRTNVVILTLLITIGHRFSLIHTILFCDQNNLTHIKSTYLSEYPSYVVFMIQDACA